MKTVKIEVGSVVWAKSGGPPMVVDEITLRRGDGDPFANCIWFDGEDHRFTGSFDLRSLTLEPRVELKRKRGKKGK